MQTDKSCESESEILISLSENTRKGTQEWLASQYLAYVPHLSSHPFVLITWYICDVLQEKVTYVGKHNFAVEWKTAGNLKKVKFQVLMDTCSRYIWEPCTTK